MKLIKQKNVNVWGLNVLLVNHHFHVAEMRSSHAPAHSVPRCDGETALCSPDGGSSVRIADGHTARPGG